MTNGARGVAGAVRAIGLAILDSYRLGARTLAAAPVLALLAAIPEFAQHVAEIHLGMFDSRAATHALAQSALRWDFGYVKLAGVALAILLTVRFWAKAASLRRSILVPLRTLALLILGIVMLVGGALALDHLARLLPASGNLAVQVVSAVFQAGVLLWLVGRWVEDPQVSLRQTFGARFPGALVILVLLASVFVPMQGLHALTNSLAIGEPHAVVWALMVLDASIVGMMATAVGSALFVGYRLGATWRGWRPPALTAGQTVSSTDPVPLTE